MVSIDRTLFDLIALNAILRFSHTIPFFIICSAAIIFIPPFLFPPVGEKVSFPQWGKACPALAGVGKGVINVIL